MERMDSNAAQRLKESLTGYIEAKGSLPWTDGLKWSNLSFDFGGRRANGELYSGFNRILTYMQVRSNNYGSDTFLTANEIKRRKGLIKAGSKGTPVGYACWGHIDRKTGRHLTDKEWRELKATDPGKAASDVRDTFLGYRLYYVFNMDQTDLEHERKVFADAVEVDDEVEKASRLKAPDEVIASFPGRLRVVTQAVASPTWNEAAGTLTVNPISFYAHPGFWYDEVFRQLAHIAGMRLGRSSATADDARSKAKEEAVCQMASSLLLTISGLDDEFFKANGSAYIRLWLDRLQAMDGKGVLDFFSLWNRAVETVGYITGQEAQAAR